MKIHTLTIEHRHGRDVTGHATHQEAEAELARYVRGWWEHERISDDGAPPPDDDAEAIALYFERRSDESATIDECELTLPVDHATMRAPILLDRTNAPDGAVIGIDVDGSIINEHERGEPYNCGESLFQFGYVMGELDPLANLTEQEAKALLAALYARIWPDAEKEEV